MANHHPRSLDVEVEFEFSRLAGQYMLDAYALVLPEHRSTSSAPKKNELMERKMKEAQS